MRTHSAMETQPPSPQLPTGPEHPRWSETLPDQSHVVIRPITRRDKEAERQFIEQLSPDSRRFRFLGQVSHPSDGLLEQLTDLDWQHEIAFAAVIQEGACERIVGVSRYSSDQDGLNCECAVTVADRWQRKGLGTLLMKHLIEVARAKGMRRMTAVVSAENLQMKDLARQLGFHMRVDPEDARQALHELELDAPDERDD